MAADAQIASRSGRMPGPGNPGAGSRPVCGTCGGFVNRSAEAFDLVPEKRRLLWSDTD